MEENDIYENQLDGAGWDDALYIRGIDADGNSVLLPKGDMSLDTANVEEIEALF